MMMLVNCSGCRTPLQLPPGARSIRCAVCQAITHIADPRAVVPSPSHHAGPPATSPHSHAPPPPSPYSQAPLVSSPSVHGRKRAVICGISYKFSRHELKGCINDAKCMRYLLINKFQFPSESIIMLTGIFSIPILFIYFHLFFVFFLIWGLIEWFVWSILRWYWMWISDKQGVFCIMN